MSNFIQIFNVSRTFIFNEQNNYCLHKRLFIFSSRSISYSFFIVYPISLSKVPENLLKFLLIKNLYVLKRLISLQIYLASQLHFFSSRFNFMDL